MIAYATDARIKGEKQRRGSFPRIHLDYLSPPSPLPSADRARSSLVGARRHRRRCSCALVRAVTCPRITEERRNRPRRRGTAAEDITITYLVALPLHSRPGARRTRTCARARVCECTACVRLCIPSRVSAPERAAGGEEERVSVNGSRQDYAKPRKYEHCCPTAGRRVH